ncbi:MAG: SPOR domain-containing protein [Deltaproteobacteria bacterium]|nr:SPOR domain-containing protein [Deltaproteobacteria bacterium]
MQNDSPDLPAPQLPGGRYEVSRLLREEPWGAVWLARDLLLGAEVGLKVLPRQAPEWSAAPAYYGQEAILALRLRHPKILGLFHLERTEDYLSLVQEPFDGESLLSQFTPQKRFSLPQALHLLEQVSQALAFAHQRGGVHQALNPLNILLKGEEVRVANFAFPGEDGGPVQTLELKAYDAPEVIYGDAPTAASNVFSLGVLGFRLVAGSLPYALTFDEPFPYRMEALPADLDEIPLPLQNLLLRCLAVDPEERFPDVATFLAQLRQVRELKHGARTSEDYQAWKPGKNSSARKPAAAWAGALLGKIWQLSQPLAQKARDVGGRAGQAFMASPRRQLWGLGLAGVIVLLIWLGVRLNRATPNPEAAKPAPVAVAQIPGAPIAGPPLTETAEPPATPAPTTAKPAPGPAATLAPGPPAAAAPLPESAKPKERYMLVAGSYANQKQAQALLEKLKKGKFKATIASRTAGGKTQYVVQLGPVTGTKAAEDLAKRLKTQEKITPRMVKMPAKTKPTKPTKPAKPAKPATDSTARRASR